MSTKRPAKKAPAKAGVLKAAPLRKGTERAASAADRKLLDERLGLAKIRDALHGNVNFTERELIDDALAAEVALGSLREIESALANRVKRSGQWSDQETLWYVRNARIGYQIAMEMVDDLLDLRADLLEGGIPNEVRSAIGRAAAQARIDRDPRTAAMTAIREQWLKTQTGAAKASSDAAFARRVVQIYPIVTEGGVKNAISRWRKKESSN